MKGRDERVREVGQGRSRCGIDVCGVREPARRASAAAKPLADRGPDIQDRPETACTAGVGVQLHASLDLSGEGPVKCSPGSLFARQQRRAGAHSCPPLTNPAAHAGGGSVSEGYHSRSWPGSARFDIADTVTASVGRLMGRRRLDSGTEGSELAVPENVCASRSGRSLCGPAFSSNELGADSARRRRVRPHVHAVAVREGTGWAASTFGKFG